ncbi:haloacid dehalogenase [Paenibacillus beijingensis]|uniref:Haloacid dehalogenase n=2 Tax=Paenibacillus beijingensis TaxID=1126833 RepID=A0A0D5NS37_9BACL|nr:haloacid dehalogenase [Paenibacillus beijingensis]
MDGTLLQTETLLIHVHPRLFAALREEGLYTGETPPVDELIACLGMLLEEIWKKVMPDASEAARRRADELMLQYELEELEAGNGSLYPKVAETLRELKARGIKLFVASNGLEHYVKGIVKVKGMDDLFDDLYSAGEYETASKVELVALLMEKHGIKQGWMVGDRSSDVEAGKGNGLAVIGCAYAGFGGNAELAGADVCIEHFEQLLALLPKPEAAKEDLSSEITG